MSMCLCISISLYRSLGASQLACLATCYLLLVTPSPWTSISATAPPPSWRCFSSSSSSPPNYSRRPRALLLLPTTAAGALDTPPPLSSLRTPTSSTVPAGTGPRQWTSTEATTLRPRAPTSSATAKAAAAAISFNQFLLQLRCRDRRVCGEDGVKVVVTDVVEEETTNRTAGLRHFLLTKDTFTGMAKHAMSADDRFTSFHTVEVDFRRIPCEYREKNLAVRVEETSSRNRGHLAVRFLYQGGQTDIAAVEIAQVGANAMPSWRYMTRREGAPVVWRTSRAPAGPLQLRLVVTAGSGGKWLRSDREVLPAEWQPGEVYDTGLRLTDVAVRTCSIVSSATAGEELR